MERIGLRELRQNASHYIARVARGETVEEIDYDRAVQLLADKRAKGPAKPKAKAAAKKPAAKKTPAKKPAAKKAPAKKA